MTKNKIITIGSPGSGKSTFARKLKDITGLPLYYLDMLFHNSDKTTVSNEEFDKKLEASAVFVFQCESLRIIESKSIVIKKR